MPPKKKSKTSKPATLPCFATARLTIIGANPVQRKIWAKCGGPGGSTDVNCATSNSANKFDSRLISKVFQSIPKDSAFQRHMGDSLKHNVLVCENYEKPMRNL